MVRGHVSEKAIQANLAVIIIVLVCVSMDARSRMESRGKSVVVGIVFLLVSCIAVVSVSHQN
ncbi:hypothetical protein B9Z19DRAFT_568481 [Tuber borchii]|uniref:Uncharacterized protein n=1 Tax=Tuber borchii TaxID=42251 RepID=A0A2T6ZCI2_TUBBO|nr:hypothetical protein B9Z19DRAFT_568481 [Tuber borchii]